MIKKVSKQTFLGAELVSLEGPDAIGIDWWSL